MRKILFLNGIGMALALSACAPKDMTSYSICDDTHVTNNDCPDVTANVVIEDDINGMSK